jgi:hypothetical protein
MEAAVQRLDISHELSFAQPAFALARNTPDIIQTFYETMPNGRSHASPSGRSPNPLPKKIPGWSESGALGLIP